MKTKAIETPEIKLFKGRNLLYEIHPIPHTEISTEETHYFLRGVLKGIKVGDLVQSHSYHTGVLEITEIMTIKDAGGVYHPKSMGKNSYFTAKAKRYVEPQNL